MGGSANQVKYEKRGKLSKKKKEGSQAGNLKVISF
jgi:hypothetical protein